MVDSITPAFGPTHSQSKPDPYARTWRPLRFLNLYRFSLAALFTLLYNIGELPAPLGLASPLLFYQISIGYLIFSLLAMFPLSAKRPPFRLQLYAHILGDIVFITLLMHASGGVASGVGMLLVISVANGSMIAAGRLPGMFAALATITVLLEQLYTEFFPGKAEVNYPLAGLLGITLFATAILAHVLARRARESEALAHQRSIDLANMAQLTEYVIQQMQTGVMVVAPNNQVRLMNSAAWQQLGAPLAALPAPLKHYCRELNQMHQQWKYQQSREKQRLHVENTPNELLVEFLAIGQERRDGTLIFLEDAASTTRQAQQLKLASLGRLTASIAHEIRNPLGAISHAGALLAESPDLKVPDKRLIEIISEQSHRINSIVENVLHLGRRDRSQPQLLPLQTWLQQFIEDLMHSHTAEPEEIALSDIDEALHAYFDPNQLQQLLVNLCQNGLRHASDRTDMSKVTLRAGVLDDRHGYLDIIDSGPGISEENRAYIFEPFFTTESSGTGLGLYLAREMAECNHAQLRYEPTSDGHSRFRLIFNRFSDTEVK